jgi:hypothetical protein
VKRVALHAISQASEYRSRSADAEDIFMKLFACLISAVLLGAATSPDVPRVTLAGRTIQLSLVRGDDLTSAEWPNSQIRLESVETTVEGSNVLLKLKANGIAPDTDALAIVYELNPSIVDLNSIPRGVKVRIPSVETSDVTFHSWLARGYLVRITADPDLQRRISDQTALLESLRSAIPTATTDTQIQRKLETIIAWLADMDRRFKRRTEPPLRRATVDEIGLEAEQISALLQASAASKAGLTDREKQQVNAVFDDLQIVANQFSQTLASVIPEGEQSYSVVVAIKPTDGASVDELRVYYILNGLYRPLPSNPAIQADGFSELGSGKSKVLLMKNYRIWAAKDGDPNHPRTTVFPLNIDPTAKSPITVELSLVGQP